MRLVTKNIIRRIFQDIQRAHYQIFRFGYGELWELKELCFNEDTQEIEYKRNYPILFVSEDIDTIQGKTIFYGYKIVIADIVRSGETNETEVSSDTFLIIQDVIAQIQNQAYGFILDESNITIEPFTERFADMLTGHIATVRLKTGYEYNRCQIPSDFISISNPYIPLDEEGINERDPLSWHRNGNNLPYEGYLGTTSQQAFRVGTGGIVKWRFELDGTFNPNASGAYDLGSELLPVRNLEVLTINGIPYPPEPAASIVTKTYENVNTEIIDPALIGGTIDKLFIYQAGTEQITIGNVESYDSLTGTIIFASDLGGSTVKLQLFP